MELSQLKGIVESLLFAAGDQGLTINQISQVLDLNKEWTDEVIHALKEDYRSSSRGIMIVELAGTYQLVTKKECSPYLKKLVESPHHSTLSQASLETLAIIAYKQPITRAEIEEIRGVKTERPLQTLVGKGLIKEVGRAEGTGRAILYGTTKQFLDYFGLKSMDELPPLTEEDESFSQEEADLFFTKFSETVDP